MGNNHDRTLGDYFDIQRGTTYKSQLLGLPGPVLLGLATIQRNGGFRSDSLKTYGGQSPSQLLVHPGELYASLKDVTQAADLLGAVARLPQKQCSGRLTQDTVKLIPKETNSPLNYLYWILRTPHYRAYCRAHATGTTNLGLPRNDFLAYPIPELTPTRELLVRILNALDDKIALNERMNETLEAMARALFKSWFVDFDPVRAKSEGRDTGLPQALSRLFPDAFEDFDLGEIPVGWCVSPVYDIATFVNGAAYRDFEPNRERAGLPIIKIAELKAGVTDQTAYSAVAMQSKYRIDSGDILFSWSGNPDTSIDTFVWALGPAWLNQHIFRVIPPREIDRTFVLMSLRYLKPVFTEIARNKQTTGLGHVTAADLKRLRIVKPPPEVLSAWNARAEPLVERTYQLQLESSTLTLIRSVLLPQLISGEIRMTCSKGLLKEYV